MPDDYYVSQYSGEEIDALLGGAGEGTVRYDAAQSLTDAQKTQARANIAAAPDGFGLGNGRVTLTASDDLDNVTGNGWYSWGSLTPANAPALINVYSIPAYCAMFMIDSSQIVVSSNDRNNMAIRTKNIAGWTPWEYINPPLKPGVEYRTTERYLGKPVYIKTVQAFSSLTGSDAVNICEVPVGNADKCISCTGETDGKWSLPSDVIGGSNDHIYIGAYAFDANTIKIYARTNRSGWPNAIRVTIKYTKTTD